MKARLCGFANNLAIRRPNIIGRFRSLFYLTFGHQVGSRMQILERKTKMCGSRKYPYPPHGGFFQFDPPPPMNFRSRGSRRTPPTPSEIPRFCHMVPIPPGKFHKRINAKIKLFLFILSPCSFYKSPTVKCTRRF